MLRNKWINIISFFILMVLFFGPTQVRAGDAMGGRGNPTIPVPTDKITEIKQKAKSNFSLLPNGYTDAPSIIGFGIRLMMMFMGAIMFLLVVYGGALWMSASGNAEQISKAKNIIIWSALGVSAMLVSYMIINFVFSKLEKGA